MGYSFCTQRLYVDIVSGRPKLANEGTIIDVIDRPGYFWEEQKVIYYPKPNVTCYSFYLL